MNKLTDDIAEQVALMLPRIRRSLMTRIFTEIQIPVSQLFVIMYLTEMEEQCHFKDLCQFLNVSAPTVTGIVDRLEKSAYVKRVQDKNDRRATNLILTDKGRKLSFKLKTEMKKQIAQVLEALTVKDQEKYLEIITKIYGAIQ